MRPPNRKSETVTFVGGTEPSFSIFLIPTTLFPLLEFFICSRTKSQYFPESLSRLLDFLLLLLFCVSSTFFVPGTLKRLFLTQSLKRLFLTQGPDPHNLKLRTVQY